MPFIILEYNQNGDYIGGKYKIELFLDRWDDWAKYRTQFFLSVTNLETGEKVDVGSVKIGQKGLLPSSEVEEGVKRAPFLEQNFEQLSEEYFSLGQTQGYYEELLNIPDGIGLSILNSLNDICYKPSLQEKFAHEEVMGESLTRDVSMKAIEKYVSIITGKAVLTEFNFDYYITPNDEETKLSFAVVPDSFPPSNVHILIGRNGVGKSYSLKQIANINESNDTNDQLGFFLPTSRRNFLKVLHVIFSIFDANSEYCVNTNGKEIIGIVKQNSTIDASSSQAENTVQQIKNKNELSQEFSNSVLKCVAGVRKERLQKVLSIFEYDEVLKSIKNYIFENELTFENLEEKFNNLSSGHAVVLLAIVQLVEKVDEKTLILLDEPESHLHPPLLSAFIRAVSFLAQMRNAVVICATHSPIVVQEVPKSCVWKIYRENDYFEVKRPAIETFGENLSVLTNEIFRFEVEKSGFHKLLANKVSEGKSYEEIIEELNGQLGFEGKLLLSNMIENRA